VNRIPNRSLLASCWTWAGDAAPLRPDESSPLGIRDRVDAVASVDWSGVGLIHADLPKIERELGLADFKRLLDDNGITTVELEFLADWWKTGSAREESDRWRRILFDACEKLGVSTMKIGAELGGESVDNDAFAREFDALATQARNVGTRVALEPMPMNNLVNVARGAQFVKDVGNPAGGLTVDTWHVRRAGTDYASLVDILPMEYVFVVEIDDGADAIVGGLWADTINERRYPGRGDFDTAGFVAAMVRAGWTGHWGVEILSNEHRARELGPALVDLTAAVSETFDRADELLAAD
jgi:sugar phosphate isomerase/epimerase